MKREAKKSAHSVLITGDEMHDDCKVCKIIDHYEKMDDLGKITCVIRFYVCKCFSTEGGFT